MPVRKCLAYVPKLPKDQLIFDAYMDKVRQELLTDLQQRWTEGDGELEDQYGFTILVNDGFKLIYKGNYLLTVYSLATAKVISTIILNDMIQNMNVVKIAEAKLQPVFVNPDPIIDLWKPV